MNNMEDYDAITEIMDQYLAGARSGRSDVMKLAFREDATIFGHAGDDLFAGAIQSLFAWTDENGPSPELQAQIASIDLAGTVATVRLELDNWTGLRFTDLFTLIKIDGAWRVANKVFHLHASRRKTTFEAVKP